MNTIKITFKDIKPEDTIIDNIEKKIEINNTIAAHIALIELNNAIKIIKKHYKIDYNLLEELENVMEEKNG